MTAAERPDETLLWPVYDHPDDLVGVESVPLEQRGLPGSTYDLLRRAAERWPHRTALCVLPDATSWETPRRRTYADLLGDVHQFGNALTALGVGRHDAVALLAPNCDELVTALLGAQLAGIASPMNPGLAAPQVAELLRRSGARVLVSAVPELDQHAFETCRALSREGLLDHVVLVRPTMVREGTAPSDPHELPDVPGARVHLLHTLAAPHRRDRALAPPPSGADLAAFFHTGGTTGVPKLAAHTHANEVADAWMIAANSVLEDDAVIFAALPLFHVNALVVTLLAPLFKGHQAVWAGPLGYRDLALYSSFWRIVERYGISTMSAVPTVYAVLATLAVDADIRTMRFAMVGASALPSGVRASFEEATGIRLLEGYGMTEATCASVRSFLEVARPDSVGQRLPYQRIRVIAGTDADGDPWRPLAPGETGTITIQGPTVFPGYVVGHDEKGPVLETAGTVVNGWLDTGDLGHVDPDGFLHLTGRVKDLIIRGGHNIDPRLVEDALESHPDVTAALAVGQPDRHAGEVPVAYVTLVADAVTTEDDLKQHAAHHVTEAAAAPRAVRIVDALPTTAVGKPFKVPLRADAARRAVDEALVEVPGVVAVTTEGGDIGTVAITVTVAAGSGAGTRVEQILSTFALPVTVRERS